MQYLCEQKIQELSKYWYERTLMKETSPMLME